MLINYNIPARPQRGKGNPDLRDTQGLADRVSHFWPDFTVFTGFGPGMD